MKNILRIALAASVVMMIGAGCGSASTSDSASSSSNPTVNSNTKGGYPGTEPYKAPTSPPPTKVKDDPNGPH